MPIFCHDSPYHTSLSSSVWPIVTGFACFASIVGAYLLYYVVRWRRGGLWLAEFTGRCYTLFSQGMQKTVEEAALKTSSEIVNRAFMWTFDSLDKDHELERFFLGLPGFRSSKVITDPLPDLTSDQKQILSNTLTGLMDRTFSSDLLPVPVKERRAMVCMRAIDPVHFPDAIFQLFLISSRYRYSGPLATGFVQIVKDREVGRDDDTVSGAQAISSTIVARLQPRDDSWFSLASNELGFPEVVLRGFATHGDSLSLAVLLHVARQQFVHFRKSFWPSYQFRFVLAAASKFEVQDTLPELQNEFCALWNQIVRKVQNDNNKLMASSTLGQIRNVYIALHQHTDCAPTQFSASTGDGDDILWEPSSYPVCNIPGHHPDSPAHIHDDNTPTTPVRTALHDHDNTTLVPSIISRSPDTTSASAHSPLRVDESVTDVPLLDKSISPPAQTTLTSCHIPFTSPDPITTLVIHEGIDAPSITMQLFTPESSAAAPPSNSKSSTSPSNVIAVEHTAVSYTALGDLNTSSSASPTPVLDYIPPAGLFLPSDSGGWI